MKLCEIAIGVVLRIPEGWDKFSFRGFTYRRDRWGRFVIDRKVA